MDRKQDLVRDESENLIGTFSDLSASGGTNLKVPTQRRNFTANPPYCAVSTLQPNTEDCCLLRHMT